MPEFNQTTFLGATVTQFNCNLGWNKEATTVSIGLVEDESNGDNFINPGIFSLSLFRFESFSYHGILTNIDETKGQDGNPLINVTLTDPRQFLSGVHLILGGYNIGVFGVPNLYNIYGYLENISYGNSHRTSAGIPYAKVREGLLALINLVPIVYRGITYLVDLSGLPNIPGSYYISSTDMTLLDFIDEVCEVANHDYIVELDGNVIKFLSINRNQEYSPGSIKAYVDSKQGYSSSSISIQGEYNTINKFITGPSREDVFFQFFNNDRDVISPVDDTITNYWGTNRFGNVIVQNFGLRYRAMYGNMYSVTVEGFAITDRRYLENAIYGTLDGPFHDTKIRDFTRGYTFDLGELRTALVSREAWESYILFNDYVVPENNPTGIKRSVHEGKSKKIQLAGEVELKPGEDATNLLFTDRPLVAFNPTELSALKKAAAVTPTYDRDSYIQQVYDFVKNYAESFFGVKLMVKIPFVLAKYNEFAELETSFQPVDSGYIDESLFSNAIQNNLLPYNIDLVKNSENKIETFIRVDPPSEAFDIAGFPNFDNPGLDVSQLPVDSYYLGNGRVIEDGDGNPETGILFQSLFVKCTVDPNIVFINKSTAFDPRVVINLPGKINSDDKKAGPEFTLRNMLELRGLNPNQVDIEVAEFKKKVGSDAIVFGGAAQPTLANMVAVPLRNNLLTYGPWYTQNGQGKVEFMREDNLSPWNYGGFANLDAAANILVSNMSEARFFGEGGTIEFAGVPDVPLGRAISLSGPIITNMSTSVDSGGVVTRYTLNTWDQKSGRNAKYLVDQFKRLNDNNKKIAESRRELNKLDKPQEGRSNIRLAEKKEFPRRVASNSSSQMMCADISSITSESIERFQSNSAVMPLYTTLDNLRNEGWAQKGGVSLDGLYRPFTIDTSAVGIAKFENPDEGTSVNADDLNPYQSGHDIQVVFHGAEVPKNLSRQSYTEGENITDYRPVALRGPLVLAGWGYDTDGKPVPSPIDDPVNEGVLPEEASDTDFMDNYLQRSDQWKVGPVDLRWDRKRKVWAASNIGENVVVKVSETLDGYVTTTDIDDDATSETEVFSGPCTEYDIVEGILTAISAGGTLHNVNQAILPAGSFCVALKKSADEYIYCEGGKEVFDTITSIFLSGNDLYAVRKPFYGYAYSGEDTVELLIQGRDCG